jgi:ribulose 1,5-bisphosphate carboxylase large subunit-like protein
MVLNKILKGVDFTEDDKKFKSEVFNSVITTYHQNAEHFILSKSKVTEELY